MQKNSKIILSSIVTILSFIFFSLDIYSAIGLGIFIFFSIKFLLELGEKIEIKDIIIILASLQWIVGPLLTYKFYSNNIIYYMAVESDIYMKFVVPATFLFILGLYAPLSKIKYSNDFYLLNIKKLVINNKNLDIYFIIVGVFATLIIEYVPGFIRFIVYLISGLRFIGLFLLYFSERKNKIIYVISLILLLFIISLKYTLFHELLLWLLFFAIVVSFIIKPTLRTKIIYLFAIFVLGFVIQTVKFFIRDAVSKGDSATLNLFASVVNDKVVEDNIMFSEQNLQASVLRINQGWIIARIMYYTPTYEPFANGETIKIALNAALVPRFLNPNKVSAGGRTYFTRFTGKDISDNTSMGLGLLGEAYANYGIIGGSVFMFIMGLFYNIFIFQIYKLAKKYPTLIFFLPLLFFQVVKAETDFSVIINHLVKASMFTVIIFFTIRNIFNIKI